MMLSSFPGGGCRDTTGCQLEMSLDLTKIMGAAFVQGGLEEGA